MDGIRRLRIGALRESAKLEQQQSILRAIGWGRNYLDHVARTIVRAVEQIAGNGGGVQFDKLGRSGVGESPNKNPNVHMALTQPLSKAAIKTVGVHPRSVHG